MLNNKWMAASYFVSPQTNRQDEVGQLDADPAAYQARIQRIHGKSICTISGTDKIYIRKHRGNALETATDGTE